MSTQDKQKHNNKHVILVPHSRGSERPTQKGITVSITVLQYKKFKKTWCEYDEIP